MDIPSKPRKDKQVGIEVEGERAEKAWKLYNVNLLILSVLVVFPFSDFPIAPVLAPTFLQIKPFLGTVLGIFGAVVLILSAIILAVRLKGSNRRDRARAISNTITMSSTLSPSLQNGVILRESSSADSIDKNPDIIPQGMYDNSTIALYTHSTDAARMYVRSKLNKIHHAIWDDAEVIGRNEARKRDNGISRDISSLLSSPTHLLLSRYTFAVCMLNILKGVMQKLKAIVNEKGRELSLIKDVNWIEWDAWEGN